MQILVGRNWPLTETANVYVDITQIKKIGFNSLKDLFNTMENKMRAGIDGIQGVGLAATQLGIPLQIMIIENENKKVLRIVNPKIQSLSEQTTLMNEGCLSFPHVNIPVRRSEEIVVDFDDQDGYNSGTLTLKGLNARIFQHEYDHLHGYFFFDRGLKEPEATRQMRRSIERMLVKLDERGQKYSAYMQKLFSTVGE
ncbi:MAG TPA: peptide deformylase [Hanamia sp.]|nr:peptide deformylase [Hanamia sp.]